MLNKDFKATIELEKSSRDVFNELTTVNNGTGRPENPGQKERA
jgi:hypothetical protein